MTDCTNCGASDAKLWSFDLDLPAIRLCDFCSVTITLNPEMFAEMGQRKPKRKAKP